MGTMRRVCPDWMKGAHHHMSPAACRMLWRPSRPRARGHACRGAAASPGLQLGIGTPQTFGTKPHQGHPIPSEQKGNPGFVMAEFLIEEVKLAPRGEDESSIEQRRNGGRNFL